MTNNIVYLVSGTAALNKESAYKHINSLKGTKKDRPLRAHHSAKEPIRKKEDYDAFCNYFLTRGKYRNYLLFVLGIELGVLRSCDLLKLRIADVFDGRNCRDVIYGVIEQKTNKRKNIYITKKAQEAIMLYLSHRKYKSLNEPLFLSQKGNQLSTRQAREILNKAAKEIGISYPVAMHTLRKTWGYHTLLNHKNDNMALIDVMRSYKHTSPEVTLRYIGYEEDHRRALSMDFEVGRTPYWNMLS